MNAKPTFMHQPVMMAAQQDQVMQGGFAPISPVMDVMGIDKAAAAATGETATPVATLQGPSNGGRHGPGFAAHAQGLEFTIFRISFIQPMYHAGITT